MATLVVCLGNKAVLDSNSIWSDVILAFTEDLLRLNWAESMRLQRLKRASARDSLQPNLQVKVMIKQLVLGDIWGSWNQFVNVKHALPMYEDLLSFTLIHELHFKTGKREIV